MSLKDKVPNIKSEIEFFRTQHLTSKRPLKLEDLVTIRTFDQKGECLLEAARGDHLTKVLIKKNNGFFEIFQNGDHLSTLRDEVTVNKRAYQCYKVLDEDRFELVDQIKMPADETVIEEERRPINYYQQRQSLTLQISELPFLEQEMELIQKIALQD